MPLHTFAGFVAEFPTAFQGDTSPGEELAQFLVTSLRKAGFRASQPSSIEWAWEFDTDGPAGRVRSLLGFVEGEQADAKRQWLLTNEHQGGSGCLPALFGGHERHQREDAMLASVCTALHQSMASDARFHDLRWHDPATFDSPGDQPRPAPLIE